MDAIFKSRVEHFLACKRIAIAGYSRKGKAVGNHLYEKFEKNGYEVIGLNPHAEEITNIKCYKDISAAPDDIQAVMIASPPDQTKEIIQQCIDKGIKHVWIHKSFGNGSYDKEAVQLAEDNNIEIIPKACPMMFLEADGFHRCVKWFMNVSGSLKV